MYSHVVQLYLCGFNERQLEKLTHMVDRGGGVRCSMLNDTVTHVVIEEREFDVLKRIQEANSRQVL